MSAVHLKNMGKLADTVVQYAGPTVSKVPAKYVLQYAFDWLLAVVLGFTGKYMEYNVDPFYRQFNTMDERIGHPFTQIEQVPDAKLYLFAIGFPLAAIIATTIGSKIIRKALTYRRGFTDSDSQEGISKAHLLHVSVLALTMALGITGVSTECLKVMIGKPRPDFLVRCKPKQGTPLSGTVSVNVCTAPLGKAILRDGFKSSPSGHSSIAFCGLGFLSLWILGQSGLFGRKSSQSRHISVHIRLIPLLPVFLATWIALTRTQDYRHDFKDIFLGGLIGSVVALTMYVWFFNDANGLEPGISLISGIQTPRLANSKLLDSIPTKTGYDIV
ncbi:unnamed protein product [Kuraishia capsulata CBS 1993]|uniref:Phosphatidic acid phosphatase type 2/haloperoxidase domain-containing protein n=1 Tax=Kuraishia capsulata CBS 1993 TaxID=1382522 RepID=W6MK17_9ASCO|nr:uncharacterized protein KUCA_T00002863001 [Kuraishia capsulata CBS 1993]CDK26889.1 unnamed protein product [Kuraishia capsulata CBS 1993]